MRLKWPCRFLVVITLSDFYKKKFGRKVYKVAVDLGCTCPTRDGSLGNRGCVFCSENGSGDFMPSRTLSIPEQIEGAKAFVNKKAFGRGGRKAEVSAGQKIAEPPAYIAYFQNFTNTYGDPEILRQKYYTALACPGIVGIDIATRPDCLSSEILGVIKELSEITFVTVELGLQTIHEETAVYIRRGYKTCVYDNALARLKEICPCVHIVTQLILGLPGESDGQMLDSVRHAVQCGSDGIKLSVLYVLKGTDLEKDYLAGKFECLTKEHYFELIKKVLPLFTENLVVHRLTGDGPKKILTAPLWTANKRAVLNELAAIMRRADVKKQGLPQE